MLLDYNQGRCEASLSKIRIKSRLWKGHTSVPWWNVKTDDDWHRWHLFSFLYLDKLQGVKCSLLPPPRRQIPFSVVWSGNCRWPARLYWGEGAERPEKMSPAHRSTLALPQVMIKWNWSPKRETDQNTGQELYFESYSHWRTFYC